MFNGNACGLSEIAEIMKGIVPVGSVVSYTGSTALVRGARLVLWLCGYRFGEVVPSAAFYG